MVFSIDAWLSRSTVAAILMGICCLGGCGGNQPISSETSKFEVADDSTTESDGASTAIDEPSQEPAAGDQPEALGNTIVNGDRPGKVVEETPNSESAESRPAKGATGVYKPPKGAPETQRKFIQTILEAPIKGNSVQSQKIDFEDKRNAAIASCAVILADAKATSEDKEFAIMTKFRVLTEMAARLQDDSYAQQAMDFAAQLQAKEKGSVEKELGVAIGVSLLPQQFAMVQRPNDEDVQKLVEGYLSYLVEGPLPPMYQPGLQIAKMLGQQGYNVKAIEVIEAMATAFSQAEDLQDKEQAVGELQRLLKLYQVDFPTKLRAAIADDQAFPALEKSIDEILKYQDAQSEWLQFIYGIGATLEKEGRTESAGKVFERVAKLNEKSKDEKTSEMVKRLLSNAEARKKLLGTELDFTAQVGSQKEFKLSSLKGKPVLLLFWTALDRGLSFSELENIQEALLATRSAFEVVLVNIDDKPEIFKEFSEIQKVSWAAASVRCPDASKEGMESDLEKKIGLDQLPYSLLLNAEGKVVANFAQGSRLEGLVANAIPASKSDGEKKEVEEANPELKDDDALEGSG